MNDQSFWKSQFDKLLVSLLVVAAAIFVLHFAHNGAPHIQAADKAWQVLFTLLGLLSGLITGKAFQKINGNGNGNGAPSPAPQAPQEKP